MTTTATDNRAATTAKPVRKRKPPTFPPTTTEDIRDKLLADIAAARKADEAAQATARITRSQLEETTVAAMRAKLRQSEIVAACGLGRETVRVLGKVHGIEAKRGRPPVARDSIA